MIKLSHLEIDSGSLKPSATYLRIQLIAYFLLGIFLVLAFLGLFGVGLITTLVAKNNYMQVQYPLTLHRDSIQEMDIYLTRNTSDKNTSSFWISNNYLDHFILTKIYPTPIYEEISNSKITFYFRSSNNFPIKIKLFVEPKKVGLVNAEVGINKEILNFKQFIYP